MSALQMAEFIGGYLYALAVCPFFSPLNSDDVNINWRASFCCTN